MEKFEIKVWCIPLTHIHVGRVEAKEGKFHITAWSWGNSRAEAYAKAILAHMDKAFASVGWPKPERSTWGKWT